MPYTKTNYTDGGGEPLNDVNLNKTETALKTAFDHTESESNPHNVTKTQIGLSNVDNTSDLNKPISTATQTALNSKAGSGSSNTFTAMQRSTITTDNDGSFDLTNGTNDFKCTPSGAITLDFTSLLSGAGGEIILDNTSGQVVSLGSSIKSPSGTATSLSTSGIYRVSYKSDGVNVFITASGALV